MGPRLVMLNFYGADNEVGDELEAQIAVYLARNKVDDALWQSPLAHKHTHRHTGARAPCTHTQTFVLLCLFLRRGISEPPYY